MISIPLYHWKDPLFLGREAVGLEDAPFTPIDPPERPPCSALSLPSDGRVALGRGGLARAGRRRPRPLAPLQHPAPHHRHARPFPRHYRGWPQWKGSLVRKSFVILTARWVRRYFGLKGEPPCGETNVQSKHMPMVLYEYRVAIFFTDCSSDRMNCNQRLCPRSASLHRQRGQPLHFSCGFPPRAADAAAPQELAGVPRPLPVLPNGGRRLLWMAKSPPLITTHPALTGVAHLFWILADSRGEFAVPGVRCLFRPALV